MKKEMHHLGAKVPVSLWRRLTRRKKKTGLPVGHMIRVALEDYLLKVEEGRTKK